MSSAFQRYLWPYCVVAKPGAVEVLTLGLVFECVLGPSLLYFLHPQILCYSLVSTNYSQRNFLFSF